MSAQVSDLFRRIAKDIKVELDEEFDLNFSRQGFMGEQAWDKRNPDLDPGRGILTQSGALRRATTSQLVGNKQLIYTNDRPYARIHNEGGTISVTRRMKSFFWAKYYEAGGRVPRLKGGGKSQSKPAVAMNARAEFFKNMALKKEGSQIKIPQRQFIGDSPKVQTIIHTAMERNIEEDIKRILNPLNDTK